MRHFLIPAAVALLSISGTTLCEIQKPEISLWGRMTMGQVVSSPIEEGTHDYNFKGEWLENIDAGVRLNHQLTPSLLGRFNLGLTVNASRVQARNTNSVELTSKIVSAYLLDASMQYSKDALFGTKDSLTLEFGYFPFKYNPQSTNLGEYLFRSGTYPGVVVSGFENSIDKPKIAGIHAAYGVYPWVNIDAIFNTELDIYPLRDINFTALATSTVPQIASLSLGVQFAHMISMDRRKTTPGLNSEKHPTVNQWVGYIDPETNDTTLYTFRGTKLMGRAMLDLKGTIEKFSGELSFLGKEDLKLYGEAAILGVKNYPGWYNELGERIPVTAGMNWPTHQFASYCLVPGMIAFGLGDRTADARLFGAKMDDRSVKTILYGGSGLILGAGLWALEKYLDINTRLDLLSFEIEFFKSPYWNSQEFIWKNAVPVPYTGSSAGMNYASWHDSLAKTDDNIKWSIYLSKKFSSWFRLSGQIACDHTPRNWYTAAPPSFVKYTELVPRTSEDWYYMLRASFYF
ncbi:MAG: hypothetical protein GX556_07160 [Fibrobacter sp.]|nr:hypothetical protein [Fibrobacter sp.]